MEKQNLKLQSRANENVQMNRVQNAAEWSKLELGTEWIEIGKVWVHGADEWEN
jgi:hypothetical protein